MQRDTEYIYYVYEGSMILKEWCKKNGVKRTVLSLMEEVFFQGI